MGWAGFGRTSKRGGVVSAEPSETQMQGILGRELGQGQAARYQEGRGRKRPPPRLPSAPLTSPNHTGLPH